MNCPSKAISISFKKSQSLNFLRRDVINLGKFHLINKHLEVYYLLVTRVNVLFSQLKEEQINNMRKEMQPSENSMPPLPPVDNEAKRKYSALLIEQIESIRSWDEIPEDYRNAAVKKFMGAIGRLYLDYYQFHLDESKDIAHKYKSILDNSTDSVFNYISKLEYILRSADEMDDPWEKACIGRTNIEAFNAMFGDSIEILDSGRIEKYMQERKGTAFLSNNLIPKNVPSSHWWWFEDYL